MTVARSPVTIGDSILDLELQDRNVLQLLLLFLPLRTSPFHSILIVIYSVHFVRIRPATPLLFFASCIAIALSFPEGRTVKNYLPGRIQVSTLDDINPRLRAQYDIEACETSEQLESLAGELYPAMASAIDFPYAPLFWIVTSKAMLGVGPAINSIGMIVPHTPSRTLKAAESRSGRRRIANEADRQWGRVKREDYDVGSPDRRLLRRFLTGISIAVELDLEGNFMPDMRLLMSKELFVPNGVDVFDFVAKLADPLGRLEQDGLELFRCREMEAALNPFS